MQVFYIGKDSDFRVCCSLFGFFHNPNGRTTIKNAVGVESYNQVPW